MKTTLTYLKPECEELLIRQEAAICQSYNVNSLNNYNQSMFDDDDWDA